MRRVSLVTWTVETELWCRGCVWIAGVDEAGRGALAGPVVAAAVMLTRPDGLEGVDDSKCLSRATREALFHRIHQVAVGVGVGIIDSAVIDRVNIRQGTLLAMRCAIQQLPRMPEYVLIDGLDDLPLHLPQRPVVRGDGTVGIIAAASIVAKVTRDRVMAQYDRQFPAYSFAQHKGYGTAAHLHALRTLGPCAIHRQTFRGVIGTGPLHG